MKRKLYVAVWGMSLLAACSAPKTGAPEWFGNAVKTSDHQLPALNQGGWKVPSGKCQRLDKWFLSRFHVAGL